MLEGLAAWVLNTYVGEYVENLNTTQLSIALLQGAVELENLPLKKDALKSLDIPIEVKSGFIGKITLHIPLRRLRSEPWVISIEKLYLVAGPLSNLQYDGEKEEKNEQELKKVMLDALEEKWKIFQGVHQDASSTSSWFSYGTSMAANILENIQLNVKDVHLRYEDDKMNPACPFACGVVIKNLSVQSTDASWTPKFVSHYEANNMYKLVDLTDFSVYCDANVTMVGNLPMSELADALERDMYMSKSSQFEEHQYILQPITAQAKVRRNTSALPLRSSATPRISVELTLGDMSLSLATDQYQNLNLWQREFARHGRRRKFRKDRPSCAISDSPGKWWHFAQESQLRSIQERNKRLTKRFLMERAHTVVLYARIYSAYLKGEALTAQQKTTKSSIEEQLTFEELKVIREAVFLKVQKNNQVATSIPVKKPQKTTGASPVAAEKENKENSSLFQRWFPGWSGWSQAPSQAPAGPPQVHQSQSLATTVSSGDQEDVSLSSSSSSTLSAVTPESHSMTEEDLLTEEEIEQEIQDVIKDSSENSSFLRKDTVFARMAFLLKKGSFQLKESQQTEQNLCTQSPLVELQCSTISMEFESRPRTSAMKFSLAVGSLFVQDQTAENPVFTNIICPQAKDSQCRTAFNPISQMSGVHNVGHVTKECDDTEFFKLVYEKNPYSDFKYSLNILTQPLDIIYTPELLRRVRDLFSTKASGISRSTSSVSSWQFDTLRKQTQEELKNTLDQLLEGKASRWNINLDISAPKFIIPESVLDSNPQLVVIDLGNFRFNTIPSDNNQQKKGKSREDEGEDKFETPCSTPPNETEEDKEVKKTLTSGLGAGLTSQKSSDSLFELTANTLFHDRLYEKYRIELTEMQVLLGRLNDNWRHAYSRGTSLMHIVDRFSISIQLDRRLIITSDVQWPTAKLSGNLPSLTFHLNERKIQGLQKCLTKFSEPKSTGLSQSAMFQQSGSSSSFEGSFGPNSSDPSNVDMSSSVLDSHRDVNEDNRLVVLQFLINSLSLEVQSQGQALIELQVTGVQADVHTKPLTTSLALTVHSLLLVDALQSYGPDFELLVASHKNVILDSRSGSIKGSELNSPTSPVSPSSPASPGSPAPDLTPSISFTSFQSIQDAISSAFHSVMPHVSESHDREASSDHHRNQHTQEASSETKALILLEYEVITTPSYSGDNLGEDTTTRVLNLHFNSLDFIANQETLVEIIGFVNRTFPTMSSRESKFKSTMSSNVLIPVQRKTKDIFHVNADFKRLNVMMVRFLNGDGHHKVARKVATATMSSAKLQAEFDESLEVEGSLGGLHLLDVTPEATLYQQLISIGQFLDVDSSTRAATVPGNTGFVTPCSPAPDMFQTAADERVFSESFCDRKNACTFIFRSQQRKQAQEVDGINLDFSKKESELMEARFDMATLSYIHCPKFLDELVDCVSEFRDYMTKVVTSIKTAATEVAMGMVGVRVEKDGVTGDSSVAGHSIHRDQSFGDITNTILLENTTPLHQQTSLPSETGVCSIMINARMESPILVIPQTPNSPQVLLAHLGEIVVDNSGMLNVPNERGRGQFSGQNQDLINISLTNMNLYSVHLGQEVSVATAGLSSSRLSELTQKFGVPILYDTSVDLTIGKRELDIPFINQDVSPGLESFMGLRGKSPAKFKPDPDQTNEDSLLRQISSVLDVKAQISSPIKLSLSKEVYEQILQTADNLTYDGETLGPTFHVSHTTSPKIGVSGNTDNIPPQRFFSKSPTLEIPVENVDPDNEQATSGTKEQDSLSGGENFLAKHVEFEVPLFEVELRGDFGDGEQGLVDLKLYDFSVQYEKNDKATTNINLYLKSLQMDDLLEPADSKHRQIIMSRRSQTKENQQRLHTKPKNLMSKSCPDSTIIAPVPQMPSSLPVSFIGSNKSDSHHPHNQHHRYTQHRPSVSAQRRQSTESAGECPFTPPPSPVARDQPVTQQRREDDLIHIDVTLVDKKRPEFVNKYNKTNRFIDIDCACLDTTINLQTWVVLLDFLGLGAKIHDIGDKSGQAEHVTREEMEASSRGDKEEVNSEIKFQVESFTLIFNKPEYELAQATAANLHTKISLRDGNLSASGQLGSLSLLDQSPHGQIYRQRFVSTGRQVVEFHLFKYGLPDFALQRAFDISLKLRMSSVRYVHTHHFQTEMVAFAQHFLQLQDVLGRMRAASAGKKINETATRGSRILLDIEASSPIVVIPHSSLTHAVLVADLGNLKLSNQFIVDGQTGTLRAQREETAKASAQQWAGPDPTALQKGIVHRGMTESQLNESFPPTRHIDPMAQSLYGSIDRDLRFEGLDAAGLDMSSSHYRSPGHPGMKRHVSDSSLMSRAGGRESWRHHDSVPEEDETRENSDEDYRCLLDVISVTLSDMDLFTAKHVWKQDYKRGDLATDMEFSTFIVEREHGKLLEEKCLLELHIERNLEGDVSHTAPDFCINGNLSSVNCRLDVAQYELVRGILNHNLGERMEEFQQPLMSHLQDPKIQTVLSGNPWKGISLIVDLRNVTVELLHQHLKSPDIPEKSLARLDFIRSQLSFSGYSNQLKEVDLVSNEIRVYDTRFKNEPVNARPNVFTSILQPSPDSKEHKGLQMEMHLRSAPDSTHYTLLLNNMRLMCIFDFLIAMSEFLSKEPPDPFTKGSQVPPSPHPPEKTNEPLQSKSSKSQSPLTVSRGIITKRGPMIESVKVPFEMVLNFADTQFVVVEDSTSLDTNAVIFKNTAVIIYKPQAQDKVLSCSLQSIELFSCCLMAEEDTALSIIDPTAINVELNANPLPQPNPSSSGLLGLKDTQRRHMVLEVTLKTMNIRVSYHDMVMFLAIINSIPQQALQAHQKQQQKTSTNLASEGSTSLLSTRKKASPSTGPKDNLTKSMMGGIALPCVNRKEDKEEEVMQLLDLGFQESDILKALDVSKWNVDRAALWLTQHSSASVAPVAASSSSQADGTSQDFMLTAVELNADSITMCLIDDCGDADIPLAEISCNALSIKQEVEPNFEGKASFQILAEYYNRKLSGWEPCLEPWKCLTEWKQYTKPERKLAVQIAASDVLNLNVTSTLIDLYKQTSGNWTEDYHTQHRNEVRRLRPASVSGGSLSRSSSTSQHKRSPFIPYVIRNDTGSNIWFLTATTTPSNLSGEGRNTQMLDTAYIQASDWKRVSPGESRPFHFHRREKLRHQKSHTMHVNQLLVTVEGWQRLSPVSVDKVGVYFRHADPVLQAPPHVSPARVVFEVKQEGSARKLINVRSSLVVHNRMDSDIEIKLEATDESGQCQCMTVPVNTALPIPLSCINMRIRARPSDWPVHFSNKPLDWQHVKRTGDKPDGIRTCDLTGPGQGVYRFFVCVTRQKFPEEGSKAGKSSSQALGQGVIHPTLPGHILTLLPPVTICNLLPLELHYYLKGTEASGNLKAGKVAALHGVDISENFDLGIHLENFPSCKELTVPPNVRNTKVYLRIYDTSKRMLKLLVSISTVKGGSMRLTISSQFWLVNKSGLPLVFKQDGSKIPAAGQFDEHEQARSVTPLLFSFSEIEEYHLCQMRIGSSVHGPKSKPQWSSRFSLEGGTSKRALHVLQSEGNRPDWVYNIGIQVTPGRGRYKGTNIVTFAPRFVLDNQSSSKLAIAQHYVTKKEANQQQDYLTALPQCSLPFHWPRVDLDQLLSVKMLDIENCRWSGGFHIDKINSFHINMRDLTGKCHLLKLEVVQQGPTFFIVFADADVMPPPFRIDNFSDVPVLYYQTKTTVDKLKSFIQPQTSIPYAWDEPTLKPLRLTLSIVGGTSASYSLDKLEEGEQLHYENFIYLAATATFDRNWNGSSTELVLECVQTNNIVFKRKEKSKRTQLWRMTGTGMLEHEGSMAPRDPKNPSASTDQGLVLDIGDIAPRPGQSVPLILRKPDSRRRSTQTWRFTEQGQLCCHAGFMCVQAVGGVQGLQEGAVVVLGPGPDQGSSQQPQSAGEGQSSSSSMCPSHMLISRQKLRPGSGCVSVRVSMDGPIRVIELVDIQQRVWLKEYKEASQLSMLLVQKQVVKRMTMEKDLEDWEVYDELKGNKPGIKTGIGSNTTSIELSLTLKDGVGVSLVNSFSEELLYITLKNICVEVVSKPSSITFDASVAVIQADNQMWGAQRPVVLFITPRSQIDVPDNTPALYLSAHKVPSAKWKAEIFKHLYISTKRITLHIEEQLLWKIMQLAGVGKDDRALQRLDDSYDTHRALSAVTSIQSTRYYFGTVKLSVNRVTLSMVTSSKLSPDLKSIKNATPMRLIAFEQANIDLHSFEKYHMFETGSFLINEIMNHYREELVGQAAKILGSVDFLGNPLGLVHDITEGIAGFVKDGNVGGLLKNVTHGVSNSTAKVVSSLSDGISTVGLDEDHNLRREALRDVRTGSSSDHVMAGFKGLSHGLFGGMTSLFSQSISGAKNEGFGGLIKGVGKGVIGTVTKPVSGVLDFTSGFANALRDSSSRTSHRGPGRMRAPRCTQGPGGLLPLYSRSQAAAQTVLYDLNGNDFTEYLIAMEELTSDLHGEGNMHVLITSRQVFFLNQRRARSDNIVLNISHADILHCQSITADGKNYVELTRKTNVTSDVAGTSLNKPRVRCEKQSISKKVEQEIKYAKNLYDEKAQTLDEDDSSDGEDL